MITQIHTFKEAELAVLNTTWRGKKIRSYFQAYGGIMCSAAFSA